MVYGVYPRIPPLQYTTAGYTYGELFAEVGERLTGSAGRDLLKERLAGDLTDMTEQSSRHVLDLRLSAARDREHLRTDIHRYYTQLK